MQDSKNNYRFKNTVDAFLQIVRQHGPAECYRGLSAILMRNGPSSAIYFSAKERLSVPDASITRQFFVGACIGAVSSTIFYPFNVVRVHMMLTVGGPFVSMFR
jgi:hypothetical protein